MSDYIAMYEKKFVRKLKRYGSLKKQIKRCVEKVIDNPYQSTEFLTDISGKLNLKGCGIFDFTINFISVMTKAIQKGA